MSGVKAWPFEHALLLAGDLNCLAWPQDCTAFAVAPHAKQVRQVAGCGLGDFRFSQLGVLLAGPACYFMIIQIHSLAICSMLCCSLVTSTAWHGRKTARHSLWHHTQNR
jgi:hypothetical protein